MTVYSRSAAVTVPVSSLSGDAEETFVRVRSEDGEIEKRIVKVGKKNGGKAEILSGLNEGEEVLMGASKK